MVSNNTLKIDKNINLYQMSILTNFTHNMEKS